MKRVKKDKDEVKEIKVSKKFKIIIGISILIIIIVVGIIIFYNFNKKQELQNKDINTGLIDLKNTENVKIEDNKKINISEELKKEKITEDLKIKDIKLMSQNELTNCTATIENTSNQTFEGRDVKIIFKSKDGSEVAIVKGYIDTIQPGKTTTLNAYTMADVANAYDFDIQF